VFVTVAALLAVAATLHATRQRTPATTKGVQS
jgi:hypothetical protein